MQAARVCKLHAAIQEAATDEEIQGMPKQPTATSKSRKPASTTAARKPAKRAARKPTSTPMSTSVLGGANKERIAASFLRRGR